MITSRAISNTESLRFYKFYKIVESLLDNDDVNEMKTFEHHGTVTCFDHSLHVAYYSYMVCKALHLDYKAAARGGLLHDFFLYDWRIENMNPGLHALSHPKTALNNASKHFTLSKKEKDIIKKHMWPVTPRPPRYWESFVVSCMDKFCACKEVIMLNSLSSSKREEKTSA